LALVLLRWASEINQDRPMQNITTSSHQAPFDASRDSEHAKKRRKNRRARVRGAWIAFVGRIVAQFVGSAASIVLALVLMGKYQPGGPAATGAAAAAGAVEPATVSRPAVESDGAGPMVVVLPSHRLSPRDRDQLVAAIDAALAATASGGSTARTSATPRSTTRPVVPQEATRPAQAGAPAAATIETALASDLRR
jgi:hypothetical protein